MNPTCVAAIQWVWSHQINWDAWSAIGTISATAVALYLPRKMATMEWTRQDRIRTEETKRIYAAIAESNQEVCSTADSLLAYRDAAIALFDSAPVYHVGIQAIERVQLNTQILSDMLGVLEERPGLTDGAIYSAVAARQIALETVEELRKVLKNWGTYDPGWAERKAKLSKLDSLAAMTQKRIDGVRKNHEIAASSRAADIRTKYLDLAQDIKGAIASNGPEPENNLSDTFF